MGRSGFGHGGGGGGGKRMMQGPSRGHGGGRYGGTKQESKLKAQLQRQSTVRKKVAATTTARVRRRQQPPEGEHPDVVRRRRALRGLMEAREEEDRLEFFYEVYGDLLPLEAAVHDWRRNMRDWRGVGANEPVVINRGHRQGQPGGGGGGGTGTLFRRAIRYAAGLPQGHLLALRQPLASGIHVIQNLAFAGKSVLVLAVLAVGFRNRVLVYAVIWRLVSVGLMVVVAVMVMTLIAMTNSLVRPMLVLVRRAYTFHRLSGQRKRLQDSQPTCAVCLGAFTTTVNAAAAASLDGHDHGRPDEAGDPPLDDLGSGGDFPITTLVCGHRFHTDCIDPWLDFRRAKGWVAECPLCKQPAE